MYVAAFLRSCIKIKSLTCLGTNTGNNYFCLVQTCWLCLSYMQCIRFFMVISLYFVTTAQNLQDDTSAIHRTLLPVGNIIVHTSKFFWLSLNIKLEVTCTRNNNQSLFDKPLFPYHCEPVNDKRINKKKVSTGMIRMYVSSWH